MVINSTFTRYLFLRPMDIPWQRAEMPELVVQDDAEEATVDGETAVVAVVIDEAQLPELIQEMTDA